MEDLNDFVDGGNPLFAAQFNQLTTEVQNVIEKVGQTLSGGTLDQLLKGIQDLSTNGSFFNCSGPANVYALTATTFNQLPTALRNGMRVRFEPSTLSEAGTITVEIGALGAKSVTTVWEGSATTFAAGQFTTDSLVDLIYASSSDTFYLVKDPITFYATDSGTENAHVLSGNFPADLVDGMVFRYKPANNITTPGTCSIAAGNVAATSLKRNASGSSPIQFVANEILQGFYFEVMYTEDGGGTFTLIQNRAPSETVTDDFESVNASTAITAALNISILANAAAIAINTLAISDANIASGSWTPAITNVVGLDGVTPTLNNFSRVNDVVTFSGKVVVTDTGTGVWSFEMSLPSSHGSIFTLVTDAAGTSVQTVTTAAFVGIISALITGTMDKLIFTGISDGSDGTLGFTGQYQVKTP